MERINEKEREYRFGDSGPKYLFRGPVMEGGVIVFKPGQSMGAHYHHEVEEIFYFTQGDPLIVIDDQEYRVEEGDLFRIEPGEKHNIINDTDENTKIVFIKTPYLPDDKVSIDG